ncbi:hypothetical protein Bca4012_080796 [Brassica carinata]
MGPIVIISTVKNILDLPERGSSSLSLPPCLVRYCASNKIKDEETKWAKERLVEIDPVGRCLSYTRSLRITWGSDLTWRRSKCCQWTVEMNRMEKSVESSGRLCPILLMVGRRKTLNPTWVFVFNIWRIKWK